MKRALLASLTALALAACAPSAAQRAAGSEQPPGAPSSSTPAAQAAFPATITNCGHTLTFEQAPSRVLMLSGTAAPLLDELGVLDKVVAHAGGKHFGPAAGDLDAKVDRIQKVTSQELETGGASLSTEAVLQVNPDLVVGYDTGVDRAALAKAGIPLYSPDAFCPDYKVQHADWGLVDK